MKAHRLFYHSTLGLKVIKKKKSLPRPTPMPRLRVTFPPRSTSERSGNDLKGFKSFYMKVKASILPRLSYMFNIRSTVVDPLHNLIAQARNLRPTPWASSREREFFIDNLLVRIHFINVMIRWTGLAPWEFEFPFPGSLISTFLTIIKTSWAPVVLTYPVTWLSSLLFFITLKPRVE